MNDNHLKKDIEKAVMFFLLIALLVSACLPEPLEVHRLPAVKPEIVISSQVIPDQSLLVMVTKTFGALDANDDSDPEMLLEQIAVNDAQVMVRGQNRTDTLLSLGNGLYGGVFIPLKAGGEYHLHVMSVSMGEVYATTRVIPQVTFQDVSAELYYSPYGDTLAEITYSIVDPAEENWYMITVQEIEQEDVVENLLNPRAFTFLLPDKDFNGEKFQDTFRVYPRDYQPGDTIAVSISSISQPYYTFMELRLDNRFDFIEFVSEPVNYPSNVVGGRGFFNLYIPDIRFFVFQ